MYKLLTHLDREFSCEYDDILKRRDEPKKTQSQLQMFQMALS